MLYSLNSVIRSRISYVDPAIFILFLFRCKMFKWIVHFKWKFCHNLLTLKLFQTCMSFFLLLNTRKYILKNVGKQTVDRTLLFHSFFFSPTMEVNVWLLTFFRISSFVFSRRRKIFIQDWNNLRVSKWWQNFNCFNDIPLWTIFNLFNVCAVVLQPKNLVISYRMM